MLARKELPKQDLKASGNVSLILETKVGTIVSFLKSVIALYLKAT